MTDLEILNQILNGWHLEAKHIERAKQLVHRINIYLKQNKHYET